MWSPLDLARRGSLDNVQGCVELLGEHPDRRRPVYAAGAVIAQSRLWSGSPPRRQRYVGPTSSSPNSLMTSKGTISAAPTSTIAATTRNEFARKPFGRWLIDRWHHGRSLYEKLRNVVDAGGNAAQKQPRFREAGVIGPIPLAKLRPSDVEKLILALRSAMLSDSTIRGHTRCDTRPQRRGWRRAYTSSKSRICLGTPRLR